ncbi:MAG: EAL domain-containing protein [Anaerotignum sp.]
MKKSTKLIVFMMLIVCTISAVCYYGVIQKEKTTTQVEDYKSRIYEIDEINDKWLAEYNNEVVFSEDELKILEKYKGEKLSVAISKENAMINEFEGHIVGNAYYALLQLEKDLGIDFEISIVDEEILRRTRENYDLVSSFNTTVFDNVVIDEADEELAGFYSSGLFATTLYEIYSRMEKEKNIDVYEVLSGNTGVYCSSDEKQVIGTKSQEEQYYPNLVYDYSVGNLIKNQNLDYLILPRNSTASASGLNKINEGFTTYSASNKILINEKLGQEFLDIVNKTITEIKEDNLTKYSESLELVKCADGYYFTEEEKMFIQNNPEVLTEYLVDSYPYVFLDEKRLEITGQLVDTLKNVSAVTGLQFINTRTSSNISKITEELSNKEIDLAVGFGIDFHRINFSNSVSIDFLDNFVYMGYESIDTPFNIYKYNLGVVDKSISYNNAKIMYPAKELYVYPTVDDAYLALKKGEIDLFSDTEDQFYYFVNKNKDFNLRIIESVDIYSDTPLLTSRTENGKLLASIIQKTTQHIALDEIKNRDYPLANRDILTSYKSEVFFMTGLTIISILSIFIIYLVCQFRKTRKNNDTLKLLNSTVNNAIKVTKFAILQYNYDDDFITVDNQYIDAMEFCRADLIHFEGKSGIDFQIIANEYVAEVSYVIEKEEISFNDLTKVFQEMQKLDLNEFKLKIGIKKYKNEEDIAYFEVLCYKNEMNNNLIDMLLRDVTSDTLYNRYFALSIQKDGLTNALSRKAFFELDLEKCANKIFVYITFNNLQQVNSTFSYAVGDKILKEFVDTAKTKKSVKDIFRTDNTKFVMILHEFNEEIAEDLISYVSRVISVGNIQVKLSAKYTVLMLHNHSLSSVDTIFNIMSAAMKSEIQEGRAYCIIDDKMFRKYNTISNLDGLLREAILNDEIVSFFQPYIDINTSKVVGYETLMRWFHKGEIITPNIFLPIAIKNGLIHDIDLIIFKKSVEFLKVLQDEGLINENFSASSNFTPLTLSKLRVEDLVEVVHSVGVKANNITIEVTEQLFSDDDAFAKINKLKNAGFKIAIDDFSVGHSSMIYLKKLNADILKLDKSLLEDTQEDKSLVIYKTVVNLGLSLNAKIISEGVETQEEVEILRKSNVKIAQGYYFSKPISQTDMFEYICSKNNG